MYLLNHLISWRAPTKLQGSQTISPKVKKRPTNSYSSTLQNKFKLRPKKKIEDVPVMKADLANQITSAEVTMKPSKFSVEVPETTPPKATSAVPKVAKKTYVKKRTSINKVKTLATQNKSMQDFKVSELNKTLEKVKDICKKTHRRTK